MPFFHVSQKLRFFSFSFKNNKKSRTYEKFKNFNFIIISYKLLISKRKFKLF